GIGANQFDPGEPAPRIGLIIDAGDDVLEVRGRFERIFNDFDQDILRALLKNDDRYVMMYFGYEDLELVEAVNGQASLADDAQFNDAIESVGGGVGGGDVVAYVDVQAMLRMIDDVVEEGGDREAQQNWPVLRDALGLAGIDFAVGSGAFDADRDGLWVTRGFLAAESPRAGLLGFNDGPLDTEILAAVPQDATFLNANKFDLQAFFDTIKATATAIDPEADATIRQVLGFANLFVGRNIERDIFQQLGPEWAVYRSDSVATGIGGWIAVNKVKDAQKLETSLLMLGTALIDGARSRIDRDEPIDIDGRKATIDGIDVYYLGTPMLSPAFAVHDGYLFAALQPQSVAAAANAMAADGSILDNEKFKEYAMSMQVDEGELRGVQFYDAPETAPKAYATYIALTRAVNGGADLFKVEPVDPILPTLPTLVKNLTPGGGITYATDDGIRFESVGTFPGANVLLADPAQDEIAGIGGFAPLVGVLTPSLSRAREQALAVASMSNMRQLSLGLQMYVVDNNGKLPPTIGALYPNYVTATSVFFMPSDGPSIMIDGTDEEVRAWLDESSDYTYLNAGKKMAGFDGPQTVLLHEPLNKSEVSVGFADGRVERLPLNEARRLIRNQQ
ncbi:MAG: hypothetical protein AAF743_11760, partial [Planctomycetota bacterium]